MVLLLHSFSSACQKQEPDGLLSQGHSLNFRDDEKQIENLLVSFDGIQDFCFVSTNNGLENLTVLDKDKGWHGFDRVE